MHHNFFASLRLCENIKEKRLARKVGKAQRREACPPWRKVIPSATQFLCACPPQAGLCVLPTAVGHFEKTKSIWRAKTPRRQGLRLARSLKAKAISLRLCVFARRKKYAAADQRFYGAGPKSAAADGVGAQSREGAKNWEQLSEFYVFSSSGIAGILSTRNHDRDSSTNFYFV